MTIEDYYFRPSLFDKAIDTTIKLEKARSKEERDKILQLINTTDLKTITPTMGLTAENTTKWIDQITENMIKFLGKTEAGGITGAIMLGALMVATLPMTIGSAGNIIWERKLFQPLRKLERPTILEVGELIELYRRGKIKVEEIRDRLATLGFTDKDIENWLTLVNIIPNVQDVIRFAVREAYTPEIATRFGQYEGGDEVFNVAKKDIESTGLSQENFNKYWASHWELPSVQMGYEMLHRGIITSDDLKLLMRASDIMPFWRDKLLGISYTPYTRVDIRRMYDLDILDREGVKKAYKDIGYDEDRAEKMTEFTVRMIDKKEETEKTKHDKDRDGFMDLSKSDMLKGYRTQLLPKSEVTKYLQIMGYSPEDIDFMLAREDYQKEEEITDAYLKAYHDAYVKGIYDKNKVYIELGKLNLPSGYQNHLVTLWDLDKLPKVNMPTKAEILGFYKRGIIDKTRTILELGKLGYNQEYINWYLVAVPKELEQT
jgi:hypothetical protein